MPEVSRFRGIQISIYLNDHNPPHFHVRYQRERAKVAIIALDIIQGHLFRPTRRRVVEWASLRQQELREAWERQSRGQEPGRIEPLP